MTSKIYWIESPKIGNALLGTMARPRGGEWLEHEIKSLKMREVDFVVSLLEKSEESELGLRNEGTICESSGIRFVHFPVADVTTPLSPKAFVKLAMEMADQIRANKKVVVHCRMGIGRSSMLAGAIMINLGFQGEEVFEVIGKARKLKVPDTEEQKAWVMSLEGKLK